MRPTIKKLLTPTEVLTASFEAQKIKELERLQAIGEQSLADYNKNKVIHELYATRDNMKSVKDAYFHFSNEVKTVLLTECIYKIYNESLEVSHQTELDNRVKYAYVKDFIQENGLTTLLRTFKTKTPLLCELNSMVEKYHKIIMEKVDEKDPTTLKIDDEDKEDFFEELDCEEVDEIVEVIKTRVGDSIEKFIKDNSDDKEKIKDIIDNTQAKVDASSNETVAESYNVAGIRKIQEVKNSRNRSVLEIMVRAISESAITNETLKESFTSNNKLNMDAILESAILMYTFLETVNTTKMIPVDSKYIESICTSLNA